MNLFDVFPKALDDNEGLWTIELSFLETVKDKMLEEYNQYASLEKIEAALIAAFDVLNDNQQNNTPCYDCRTTVQRLAAIEQRLANLEAAHQSQNYHEQGAVTYDMDSNSTTPDWDHTSENYERMLKWFRWEHLFQDDLQEMAFAFETMAYRIVNDIERGPERAVALRKLLEAKDAAIRALVNPGD